MGWLFNKNSVTIWDSPSEEVLLFYSTLDYKLELIGHKTYILLSRNMLFMCNRRDCNGTRIKNIT